VDGDYAPGPYRRGRLSSGKLGKVFARLKLGLIGPSTWFDFAHHRSLRVEQSSSFGLESFDCAQDSLRSLGLNWLCFE